MTLEESIRKRIDDLLKRQDDHHTFASEIYAATLSISVQLFGADSPQVQAVKQLKADIEKGEAFQGEKTLYTTVQCKGVLNSYASEIDAGLLGQLRLEYQGQIFADLAKAAKSALEENAKDAAAVLSCAALEDMLKRFAEANGLNVEDKDMTQVINAIKSAGLLSSTESTLLKGMVPFRNKALHAEWSKVDETSVKSVIAFVEGFLSKHFS